LKSCDFCHEFRGILRLDAACVHSPGLERVAISAENPVPLLLKML